MKYAVSWTWPAGCSLPTLLKGVGTAFAGGDPELCRRGCVAGERGVAAGDPSRPGLCTQPSPGRGAWPRLRSGSSDRWAAPVWTLPLLCRGAGRTAAAALRASPLAAGVQKTGRDEAAPHLPVPGPPPWLPPPAIPTAVHRHGAASEPLRTTSCWLPKQMSLVHGESNYFSGPLACCLLPDGVEVDRPGTGGRGRRQQAPVGGPP